MEYDFKKIVNFLFGKSINKYNEVLRSVVNNGFSLIGVDTNSRIIFLNKNNRDYFLIKRDERILIFPANYSNVSFVDDFGEIIEICTNVDGDVIVSNIFNDENGVISTTSVWHYVDNLYTQIVARLMYIDSKTIKIIENRETIQMFLNTYYPKRTEIFNSLYWDMDSLRKNNFINPKIVERIQVNDGYKKEPFEELYKKHMEKVLNTVKEKNKPSLF